MISVNNTWQFELIIKSYPTIHTQNYNFFLNLKIYLKKIRKKVSERFKFL